MLKFVHHLRLEIKGTSESVFTNVFSIPDDSDQARLYWIREAQSQLPQASFLCGNVCLTYFVDESQLWRCGGRMSNSDLPSLAQTPILFDKRHHLTALIVMDARQCVTHNG